jgi:biopolymer transport protein ExbD
VASPSFVKNKPPSETATEVDLDLTPLMSMFLILLPFLVSMAVLTHLTIIEFSLPPNVGPGLQGASSEKPRLKLTMVLTSQYLLVTHGEQMLDSLPIVDDAPAVFDSLPAMLSRYRQTFDIQNEMVVASSDQVRLKNIVALMDRCKAAGFEKIGLSSAAVDLREGL